MVEIMKITDHNVIRFHLHALYGIMVKNSEKKMERQLIGGTKVFGVSLENLPRQYMPECGLVPCFLIDACCLLMERVATVGLFRKPGSLPRIKTLRTKLNHGEQCLSTALPYDVATLIKQFCRELPEPLFPSELHSALLKAQALPVVEDRTSALQLLSCLLPARNFSCLHFLFDFLFKVSQRCNDNLMTSSNLATVFTPCLLPPPNKTEMSEGRFELRVFVLRTFIENPHLFGVIPKSVRDCMEFLTSSPHLKLVRSKKGNRKRHSFSVKSTKSVPWFLGRLKVKTTDPDPSDGSSSVDRPTLRRSLGQETFPSIQLFRACSPWEDQSFKPTTSSSDCSSPDCKDSCKTPQEGTKRDLRLAHFPKFTRGQGMEGSPILPTVGKLHLIPWKRRSSL